MANNFWKDKKGRYEVKKVTIETVDQAVFDYFDKKLSISVNTERKKSKVQILFAVGERWKLIRKNKFRDENGTLILPLISVRRMNIDRTPGFGGMAQEVPEVTISSVIHPKAFNVQNLLESRRVAGLPQIRKEKIVREYITIPFPDFATVYYEISIWAQYHTQINEILEKIFYSFDHMDSFVMPVEYDGNEPGGDSYYFVGFREGDIVPQENNADFTDQERVIKYNYTIKVPAYFILDPDDEAVGYGKDDDAKKVVYKRQNAIDIKFKESVMSLEDFRKLFG